jgi:hypothetical protein
MTDSKSKDDESEQVNKRESTYSIDASVDGVSVSVSSGDKEWVEKMFRKALEQVVAEKDDASRVYRTWGKAGSLLVQSSADSPDAAREQWESIWSQMLADVEELSEKEREKAGLARQ